MTWKNYSRYCSRCGVVGPRIVNPQGVGFIHAYCRTDAEKLVVRRKYKEACERLDAQIALSKYVTHLPKETP
jgi:hypothetical protein